ncbi:TPA: helix-turn-helix transcriptional regulator [Bacillus cereus]|uniref:helix-turn-helix domain-containing protein n=1 Tax=Bacillus cereus group TaxID=86661 RepID=UPI0007729823|nr:MULTISPECIES: helix-turn-helix transcriptional regulator [Bacillus cereus group]KXI78495.1 transcriptional regulator [Bacillus cereus]KXI90006.1 transcriptional regulator [Bacillus cereus]MBE7144956.1 helix-turn-helix transcriptional regulator [Bacillus paranthracis]MCC2340873.1 helix-turn-helix domain-containing protein [Bacillus tropicus]MCU5070059.1 helix-turn-helix domain-containing protein [Bacillus pacificus]
MRNEFGMKVRATLFAKNMQQKELAKLLGISGAYLSDILRDKREAKSVRVKIIKILDMKEVS